MNLTLAVDFGSTYTKIAAFDLKNETLIATSYANTTVETDICIGLDVALAKLYAKLAGENYSIDKFLASSSAAGGLKMVAIGLTKELTTKAAKEAVLGAGAKLIHSFTHKLSSSDLDIINGSSPDIILLAGGTDGGNEQYLLYNADKLAKTNLECPIIIAGNKAISDRVFNVLKSGGKNCVIVENILPNLDKLNIDSAKSAIRNIFSERIIQAKGIDKAKGIIGDISMPTPLAVLKAASLLGKGIDNQPGFGDIIIVDVGGATTDVHSIGYGYSENLDRIAIGLPEPFEKRTVEGDIGLRYNADSILEQAGLSKIQSKIDYDESIKITKEDIISFVKKVLKNPSFLPTASQDLKIDAALAATAVEIAVQRHAGRITEAWYPTGKLKMQYGKDLSMVKIIIGTGGVFLHGNNPIGILKNACYNQKFPNILTPVDPKMIIDKHYILYALGLLVEDFPLQAFRIMKKYFGI